MNFVQVHRAAPRRASSLNFFQSSGETVPPELPADLQVTQVEKI
jgi:hypothetical protein